MAQKAAAATGFAWPLEVRCRQRDQVQEGGSRVSRTFGGAFFHSRRFAEEPLDHVAHRRASVQLAPTLVASSTAAARSTHCAGFSGRGLMSVMGQTCLAQGNEITLFT